MSNVTTLKASGKRDSDEWQMRVDLAAAFRLVALNDWHEGVANHLSLAVSADGKKFLMNPRWRHFSRVKASELLLLDTSDKETMNRPGAPDQSMDLLTSSTIVARRFVSSVFIFIIQRSLRARSFWSM